MQFVSFVYRTKRTRSLFSPLFLLLSFPSHLSLYHSESMAKLCVHLTWFFGWPLFDCWPSRGWSSIGSTLFDVAASAAALLGLKAYTFSGTSIEINVANVTQKEKEEVGLSGPLSPTLSYMHLSVLVSPSVSASVAAQCGNSCGSCQRLHLQSRK